MPGSASVEAGHWLGGATPGPGFKDVSASQGRCRAGLCGGRRLFLRGDVALSFHRNRVALRADVGPGFCGGRWAPLTGDAALGFQGNRVDLRVDVGLGLRRARAALSVPDSFFAEPGWLPRRHRARVSQKPSGSQGRCRTRVLWRPRAGSQGQCRARFSKRLGGSRERFRARFPQSGSPRGAQCARPGFRRAWVALRSAAWPGFQKNRMALGGDVGLSNSLSRFHFRVFLCLVRFFVFLPALLIFVALLLQPPVRPRASPCSSQKTFSPLCSSAERSVFPV